MVKSNKENKNNNKVNKEVAPTTENKEVAPTTENKEVAPTTENKEVAPTTENKEVAPTTENKEVAPTTENKEVAPVNNCYFEEIEEKKEEKKESQELTFKNESEKLQAMSEAIKQGNLELAQKINNAKIEAKTENKDKILKLVKNYKEVKELENDNFNCLKNYDCSYKTTSNNGNSYEINNITKKSNHRLEALYNLFVALVNVFMYVRGKIDIIEINSILKKAIRNIKPSLLNKASKEGNAKLYKESITNYKQENFVEVDNYINNALTYAIVVFINLLKLTCITDLSKNKLYSILRQDKKTENKEVENK